MEKILVEKMMMDMKNTKPDSDRMAKITLKDLSPLDSLSLLDRTNLISLRLKEELDNGLMLLREINGPLDRTVMVKDRITGEIAERVMFGSNNYLGLANDPRVRKRIPEILDKAGTGLGGPPLLNGRTSLHRELEEKLSRFKGFEETMLFSSGFLANLGWITALVRRNDTLIVDELVHASIIDGTRLMRGECIRFSHNDPNSLDAALAKVKKEGRANSIVVVEGVYSMDGDIPPLPEIAEIVRKYDGFLVVDDAHGTGVMGENGKGILEYFGMEGEVDLLMGTFSKAFASSGGFVSGSRKLIDMLRYTSRPYIFSASMAPLQIAGILAAFDIMTADKKLREALHENRKYLLEGLGDIGLTTDSPSAIVPLYLGRNIDIRPLSKYFNIKGLYMNAIEYPAVPFDKQRFRISLMATHKISDIDRLVESIEELGSVKENFRAREGTR